MKMFEKQKGNKFLGLIQAETNAAILFSDWFWNDPLWVPKSQCEIYRGDYEHAIIATDWICGKNGITEQRYA